MKHHPSVRAAVISTVGLTTALFALIPAHAQNGQGGPIGPNGPFPGMPPGRFTADGPIVPPQDGFDPNANGALQGAAPRRPLAPIPAMSAAEQAVARRIFTADEKTLAQLPAQLRQGKTSAVSLRVSEEAFEADSEARDALLSYVRGGGVVFLHTGAARAFGFRTVEAREGTNATPGQLFGRAKSAIPFGAHPLLWERSPRVANARNNEDPTQLPGVNVVFYQMQPGDHLVESHPAGTPLLKVSDLSSNRSQPLYAAAIAPFGRGWAAFTPDSVDLRHGDGFLFARNLLTLSPASSTTGATQNAVHWIGVPADAIESGATSPAALRQALQRALSTANSSAALPAFGTTPAPADAPTDAPANANLGVNAETGAIAATGNDTGNTQIPAPEAATDAPTPAVEAAPETAIVFLSETEVRSYEALLGTGGEGAGAATNLLRARLFLSRGEVEAASAAVEATAGLVPDAAEVSLWRGLLLAGASQAVSQTSPARAALLNDASRALSDAATQTSLLPAATPTPVNGGAAGRDGEGGVAGVPLAALRNWSDRLGQISTIFSLEPPLVQQFGVGDAAITVRAYADDSSLRLVIPGAQALADARNFGWRGDNEEILVFPSPEVFAEYRRTLGLRGSSVPLPSGAVGDVVGQRLLMVALPSFPIVRRNAAGQTTIVGTRNTAGNVLSRLHSYVLLNALNEGGTDVPTWLQLGIENLVSVAVGGDTQIADPQLLEQFAQTGGLLSPTQFQLNNPNQLTLAQAQAAALVNYLYRENGAGSVVETVQRLGMGDDIDQALEATTGNNEITLFRNWRDAQFGPRQFPNQG